MATEIPKKPPPYVRIAFDIDMSAIAVSSSLILLLIVGLWRTNEVRDTILASIQCECEEVHDE